MLEQFLQEVFYCLIEMASAKLFTITDPDILTVRSLHK